MGTQKRKKNEFFEIQLDNIALPSKLLRQADSQITELAVSIAKIGVLHPPIVRQISDGKYEVISGQRRILAALACGFKKIICQVMKNEYSPSHISLSENLVRQELNEFDLAQALKDCIDQTGSTKTELALLVGKSLSYISQVVGLLDLHETIQHDHRVHKLVPLRDLVSLKSIPIEKQVEAYKKLLNERLPRTNKSSKRKRSLSAEASLESIHDMIHRLEKQLKSLALGELPYDCRLMLSEALKRLYDSVDRETAQYTVTIH